MSEVRNEAAPRIDRRALVGGAIAGGAALCAVPVASRMARGAEGTQAAPAASYPHATIETDVVVVGGGLAGMFAARGALSKGASVVLVDKGPLGHSGASGINWGHALSGYETCDDIDRTDMWEGIVSGTEGLVDQNYYEAQVKWSMENDVHAILQKMGCVWDRLSDGSLWGQEQWADYMVDRVNVMPRMVAQSVRRSDAKVLDRTMVLDVLLAPDGSASGVVGVNLVSGEAVVVRAKSVVMCTGSCCWNNGWTGVGAKSNASPENTGDGFGILARLGVPLKNMEQYALYFYNVHPDGISFCNNIGFSCFDRPQSVFNGKGEQVLSAECAPWNDFPQLSTYNKVAMKQIYEGKGTANGGILFDITGLSEPDMFQAFGRRNIELQERNLGYTPENPIELVPCPWDFGGAPQLTQQGETVVPGLFYGSTQEGVMDGFAGWNALTGGAIAGENAALRADSVERQPIDRAHVQEILADAYGVLAREGEGKPASEVQREVQRLSNTYLFGARTEEGLTAAIEELERIAREDVPSMVVSSHSPQFNTEWRQAMEVPFMVLCNLAIAHAALARTETRGFHHRLDYPNMDNANWLKNVWVSQQNGTWEAEALDVVDVHVPADRIREILPEIGIGDYPQQP